MIPAISRHDFLSSRKLVAILFGLSELDRHRNIPSARKKSEVLMLRTSCPNSFCL